MGVSCVHRLVSDGSVMCARVHRLVSGGGDGGGVGGHVSIG